MTTPTVLSIYLEMMKQDATNFVILSHHTVYRYSLNHTRLVAHRKPKPTLFYLLHFSFIRRFMATSKRYPKRIRSNHDELRQMMNEYKQNPRKHPVINGKSIQSTKSNKQLINAGKNSSTVTNLLSKIEKTN